MPPEHPEQLAGRGIPEVDHAVVAAGRQARAVRAEGEDTPAHVPGAARPHLAGGDVVDLDTRVVSDRPVGDRHTLPVRAKGETDHVRPPLASGDLAQHLPRLVPYRHEALTVQGHESPTFGRRLEGETKEGEARDGKFWRLIPALVREAEADVAEGPDLQPLRAGEQQGGGA